MTGGKRRAAPGQRGFTLVEILVAITVAAMLFGICVAIYVNVSRYKSRSEGLLFINEEARGITDRIARDLAGLHVGGQNLTDYWELEKEPVAGCSGDRLTLLSATENPGKLDYCTVRYYVEGGRLYRELSDLKGGGAPGGGWPAKADSVLAEGVQKMTFSTDPASPAAGEVPRTVTVTLKIADPGNRRQPYRRFTATLRPGSEEN